MIGINKVEIIKQILESMPGVLVTDTEGKIVYVSEAYAKILQVDQFEVIGSLCYDIVPGSRMHIVAKTGEEEVGSMFKLKNGETVLVNRLPIRKDNQIIGVVAFSTLSKRDRADTISNIAEVDRLTHEIGFYKAGLGELREAKYSLNQIIGSAPGIEKVKKLIKRASITSSTVLITGETGTGKELIAHAIHQESQRSHNPFVRLNCAAIPKDLLESELFGYEEGAFTGAKKGGKPGKFELANFGTILLDEINQMPLYLQSKLLRVIQEKEIERVGGTKFIKLDVRFIFITNQNLFDLINKGYFREDLYYRVNVVSIDVPPLRERLQDLPILTEHLIGKINQELGLNISGVTSEVIDLFKSHHWPGNVRELEHAIERAANMALSGQLDISHFESLSWRIKNRNSDIDNLTSLAEARENAEKDMIIRTLKKTKGNVTYAAQILQIHRTALYHKLNKYQLKRN